MAKVDKVRPEIIEKLRGSIDIYEDKRTGPIARSWPKKIKPPYTPLQAEAQAVFSIANRALSEINGVILEAWRFSSVGKKASWTDTFRGIIMSYWKIYRVIAPIATNYNVIETDTQFKVEWDIRQLYIDNLLPEENYKMETIIIDKEDILLAPKPIYFTLLLNGETRLVAPYILFEVT